MPAFRCRDRLAEGRLRDDDPVIFRPEYRLHELQGVHVRDRAAVRAPVGEGTALLFPTNFTLRRAGGGSDPRANYRWHDRDPSLDDRHHADRRVRGRLLVGPATRDGVFASMAGFVTVPSERCPAQPGRDRFTRARHERRMSPTAVGSTVSIAAPIRHHDMERRVLANRLDRAERDQGPLSFDKTSRYTQPRNTRRSRKKGVDGPR